MTLSRRRFLRAAAGVPPIAAFPRLALAQAYPTRPLRLIIGYPPGGSASVTAHLVTEWLAQRLGASFVVESRPGAATNIATEAVVRAPADGYTLLLVAPANAINATLYEKLNYNFLRDIAPVAPLIRFPDVMVVNLAVPATTVPEFIAYAKANPGHLNMASSGNGSTIHVAGELFKMMAGVQMVHVPYRGGAAALTDLIGGRVQVIFDNLPTSIEFIRAGKLRALAVTTAGTIALAPGSADRRRIRAALRGERLVRHRRAEGHPQRDHRQAQQGDQRRPCHANRQAAVCGAWRGGACRLAGRVRSLPCRGDREMGQGGPLCGRQA